MRYRYLDLETYPRKEHFTYFCGLAYPYVGLTVNVDITALFHKIKAEKLPFFFTLCYCISRAANAVPEFRRRIIDGKIAEFDHCRTSYTVAMEDETYCYCTLEDAMPFKDFLPYAARGQEKAKQADSISEEEGDKQDLFFFSTVPWVSFTALIQPVPMPADSNPRITWGKYFQQNEKILLPVSVLCHHALVDGIHIAEFYRQLEEKIISFVQNQNI